MPILIVSSISKGVKDPNSQFRGAGQSASARGLAILGNGVQAQWLNSTATIPISKYEPASLNATPGERMVVGFGLQVFQIEWTGHAAYDGAAGPIYSFFRCS